MKKPFNMKSSFAMSAINPPGRRKAMDIYLELLNEELARAVKRASSRLELCGLTSRRLDVGSMVIEGMQQQARDREAALKCAAEQMLQIWGFSTNRGAGGSPHNIASVSFKNCPSCGVKLTNTDAAAASTFSCAIKSVCNSARVISVRFMTAVRAMRKAMASICSPVNVGRSDIAPPNTESHGRDKGGA